MPLVQTLSTALAAGLIVLAASADLGLPQTNGDSGLSPPAARRDGSKIPEKIRPEASGSSSEPLSSTLNRSGGVIHPPDGIDPGIAQAPPTVGSQSTPIIPPPGSSGESPVKPK
jgi:hypothetical protein